MARGRRLLGQLVLVLAMMASGFVGAKLGLLGTREVGASHNFNDVPPGAFYHDFVQFLVDNGITAGCAPLLYCPDQAVTRAPLPALGRGHQHGQRPRSQCQRRHWQHRQLPFCKRERRPGQHGQRRGGQRQRRPIPRCAV